LHPIQALVDGLEFLVRLYIPDDPVHGLANLNALATADLHGLRTEARRTDGSLREVVDADLLPVATSADVVRVRKERQGRIDGILRPAVRGRGERRPDRRALRRRTDVIQDGLTDGVVLRIPGIVDGVEGTRVPVECAAQDAAPPVVVGDFELGVEPLERSSPRTGRPLQRCRQRTLVPRPGRPAPRP
jgi:hypothetical protein